MLSFPVFTCKTHIISNPASRRHTVIYHLYTQLSCTQTHKCNCLGFCPENTHPTLTRPHAHVFALMETHFEHKIFWKILSALPLFPRWSWQWKRNTVHEDCWTLWISLCVCGWAVEEEDDTQCHQQQKVESHCQNHHQWRAGTSGRSVCSCTCYTLSVQHVHVCSFY